MLAVGVDIIEISRIRKALGKWGARFQARVLTQAEIAYCRGRVPEIAARFAAKEAVSKALGTGMRGIGWREIEVLADTRGKPIVRLHGRARARADELNFGSLSISLSHSRNLAVAFVVASPPWEASKGNESRDS